MHVIFEEDGQFKAGSILSETEATAQVEAASGKRSKVKAANILLRFAAPAPGEAALPNKPTVREETLAHTGIGDDGSGERIVMHRQGAEVRLRDARGQRQHFKQHLLPSEPALHAFRDSASYPELAYVRQLLESWRIYDRFNLSSDAPARAPSLAPPMLTGCAASWSATICC